MLDGPLGIMLCPRIIIKSILIVSVITHPIFGINYQDRTDAIPQHMEQEWVNRYFNSINEDTPLEEVVDFLVSLKGSFAAKGYKTPSLTELCLTLREDLIKKGVEVDDEAIELVYNEVEKREATLIQTTSFKQAITNRPLHIDFVKHTEARKVLIHSKICFSFLCPALLLT